MTVSVLGPRGPQPPYGSFAGKVGQAGGSKVYTQTFTVLSPRGPMPPYGAFAGKSAGAVAQKVGWFIEWNQRLRHDPEELERRLQAQRGFGLRKYEEMIAAHSAAVEAAQVSKSEKRAAALTQAAEAAEELLENALGEAEFVPDFDRVIAELNAAVSATRATAAIKHAELAIRLAREWDEDEEEAIMLLLH